MKRKTIEIELLHYTDQGREVRYLDLARRRDFIDAKDLEPGNFWAAQGGFTLTVDGYQTIYHGCEFYVLLRAIDFLLHSLSWIRSRSIKWVDKDEEFPEDVIARFQNGNMLRLRKTSDGEMEISYTPQSQVWEPEKGMRFFKGERVVTNLWHHAAIEALEEYFSIVDIVVNQQPDNDQSKVLRKYLEFWKHEALP